MWYDVLLLFDLNEEKDAAHASLKMKSGKEKHGRSERIDQKEERHNKSRKNEKEKKKSKICQRACYIASHTHTRTQSRNE